MNKLREWRQNTLSMAGRLTLVKAAAATIPAYTMEVILLPKSIISKMDRSIWNLLWGHREDKSHHMHLKAWEFVCIPKLKGGLGILKMETMNSALITKLAWQLATPTHRTWTKLVRAKYLRGKPVLDAQLSQTTVSWIWGSILHSIKLLRVGSCYQVGVGSNFKIKGVPWLPDYPKFRIPEDIHIPANIIHIKDLMEQNGTTWNSRLISNIFPMELKTTILKTPIYDQELESLLWIPSTLVRGGLSESHT